MGDIGDHLKQTASGGKNAFREVVAAYSDMALALAKRRLGSHALAEEAVQEAFISAFRNLSTLRDAASFSAWFRTILDRSCLSILRKESRTTAHACEDDIQDPDALDPFEVYTRYLDIVRIRKILDGLSGACREACVLRYVHGRQYSEISGILGVPLGTVKRRLHVAREQVVREFNDRSRRVIRVGHMPISDHLAVMVAHQHHDQRTYGMQLNRFLSWSKLVRQLCEGSLDAALVMAPLAMALHNAGQKIHYVLDGHHDGSAVTVSPNSNARMDKNVRLALPHAISTHRLLLHSKFGPQADIAENMMARQAMRFISPSYVINSMVKREIDGFFCSEPWSTKSAAQGSGKIVARSGEMDPGHICCILVVRDDFAKTRPSLLHAFTSELVTAGRYIAMHPRESAEIQNRYTGIETFLAERILANRHVTFDDLEPDRGRTEQLMHAALQAGMLTRPCDLDSFMSQDHLQHE